MEIRAIIGVLAVISIWGSNFSFIKIGLEELPPVLFSSLRFLIAAVPAIFFIPFPRGQLWNILGVGLFLGIIKFGLLFIGLTEYISAGLSALVLQAQVGFTIAISYLLFKERLSKWQMTGILISVAGFSVFFQSTSGNATVTGILLILLAALSWSFSNTIMKKARNVNLLHFMIWSCAVPPIPLFALSYFMETQEPIQVVLSTTLNTWLALAFVSYISTLLAFSIWGQLLRSYSAASITPFALLIPVVGMTVSNLMLDEELTQIELLGSAIVMVGLVCCVFEKRIGALFSGRGAESDPA